MTAPEIIPTSLCIPRYASSHTPTTLSAHFRDAKTVDVQRNRERAYPELPGTAPRTSSIYSGFSQLLPKGSRVWDFGCGSGLGTAILKQAGHQVLGIDDSLEALEFARQFAPDIEFVPPSQLDQQHSPADAVLVVDVLGFGETPQALLAEIHERAPNATWFLAEPRANVAQRLVAPHRTAFSERTLGELATRAGLRTVDFLSCSTFAVVVAKPSSLSVGKAFRLAEQLRAHGLIEDALKTLAELAESDDRGVVRAALLDSAELRAALGDGDTASELYLRVLREYPRDPDALAALSQLTLATGHPDEALSLAVQAMDSDSTHAAAACSLALTAERVSPAEGLKAWQLASSLAPAEPVTQSRLAEHAADAGNHSLSIAAMEQLRAHNPNQGADFHVTLAWLLLGAGRPQDAKLEAQVASAVAPLDENVLALWDTLSES